MADVPGQDIAGLYNRVAARYGTVGPPVFAHFGRQLVNHVGIASGARVLDVGAGRGAILFPAATRVGAHGYVVGIDVAEAMVAETNAEIERRHVANATMMMMDAERLTFADASFDAVLCGFVIFFLDVERVLSEFYCVLRPQGRLGVNSSEGLDERWRWYNDLLVAYHEAYGIPLGPERRGAPWTPADLPALLAHTGFSDVQTIGEEIEFSYADEEEWWASKWTHGARYPLERMQPEVLEQFKADAFAKLARLHQTGGLHERWHILSTTGTKPA